MALYVVENPETIDRTDPTSAWALNGLVALVFDRLPNIPFERIRNTVYADDATNFIFIEGDGNTYTVKPVIVPRGNYF